MKLKLNEVLTDLDGKDLGNAAEILALQLFGSNTKQFSALRAYEISLELKKNKEVELSKEECDKMKTFVSDESNLIVGGKAPILSAIIDAMNSQEKDTVAV